MSVLLSVTDLRTHFITPRAVARVETKYRRVSGSLPHPESLATLEALRRFEPQSMRGQPPVVWDHAQGFQVYDAYGNCWIDWSSGVLITNAGHGRAEIVAAIAQQAESIRRDLLLIVSYDSWIRCIY